MEEKKFCKFCGEKIDKESIVCPKCGRQLEKPKHKENEEVKSEVKEIKFYEKSWFMWLTLIFFAPVGIFVMFKFNNKLSKSIKIILSIVFGFIFLVAVIGGFGNEETNNDNDNKYQNNKVAVEVVDFSSMTIADIDVWCDTNKINCKTTKEYSNTIENGKFVSQSVEASKNIYQGDNIKIVFSLGKEPSTEYKNALKQAESYSKTLHMSKQGIFDQLTSEYGGQFPDDAAQYAIDNVVADWNSNALEQAKSYQETLSMSKSAIYDQLISQYGGQFTKSEAQYAIDHLDD